MVSSSWRVVLDDGEGLITPAPCPQLAEVGQTSEEVNRSRRLCPCMFCLERGRGLLVGKDGRHHGFFEVQRLQSGDGTDLKYDDMEYFPLASFVLTLTLAIVAWSHRRGRLTSAFALFASILSLISLFAFLVITSSRPELIRIYARVLAALGPLAFGAAMFHVLVISGSINRLDERIFGLRLRHYLWLLVVFFVLLEALLQGTTLVVDLESVATVPIEELEVGPLMVLMEVIGTLNLLMMFFILYRAFRASEPGPLRTFLRLNAAGLVWIYVLGFGTTVVATLLGYDGRPFLFLGYTVGAVFFYVAVLRYQYHRIHELNQGLERTVVQRTRHLREAQARLAQADRMASLGRLVAGVAHEFNNPAGAVQSTNNTLQRHLDKLERSLEQDARPEALARTIKRLRQGHQVIEDGTHRITEVVDRLRAFAGLDRSELRTVDLNRSVQDTLELLLSIEQDRITLNLDLGPLPPILCYPAQLNQVLQNVLINAVEAIEGKGTITVRTRRDGDQVILSIHDSGPGIPEEVRDRLFEPGFTTKSRGVGTGLGLAIAYQVMSEHHGSIEVTSEAADGATVALRIPVEQQLSKSQV